MNPIDNYRQSEFGAQRVIAKRELADGIVLGLLAAVVIGVDFYLLASLL